VRSNGQQKASARGFTLVELAVVMVIIAVLAALTVVSFARSKPRADMMSAAAELQALLHQAREAALQSGNPVVVLVYPNYTPANSGQGYFIVYQDASVNSDFFNGGAVAFATYNPAVLAAGGTSVVIDTMTLPSDVMVGPSTGMGSSPLAAPLQNVIVNVACSFCGSTAGAVAFSPIGVATFYSLSGTTQTTVAANGGASLSLTYNSAFTNVTGQVTLVIFSASGAVQVFGPE
jgi:prepilin-type N-terminal cleavage/methylation domain-containing protein